MWQNFLMTRLNKTELRTACEPVLNIHYVDSRVWDHPVKQHCLLRNGLLGPFKTLLTCVPEPPPQRPHRWGTGARGQWPQASCPLWKYFEYLTFDMYSTLINKILLIILVHFTLIWNQTEMGLFQNQKIKIKSWIWKKPYLVNWKYYIFAKKHLLWASRMNGKPPVTNKSKSSFLVY